MSLSTIERVSNEQAKRAAKEKRQPYIIYDKKEIDSFFPWAYHTTFPFPNLGNYCPKNYRRVKRLFVDKTGFDNDGPALSISSFKRE